MQKLRITDLLKIRSFDDVKDVRIVMHSEDNKEITAYNLWRAEYDSRIAKKFNKDLNSDYEFFNRTHIEGKLGDSKWLFSCVKNPETEDIIFTGFYKIKSESPVKKGPVHQN